MSFTTVAVNSACLTKCLWERDFTCLLTIWIGYSIGIVGVVDGRPMYSRQTE